MTHSPQTRFLHVANGTCTTGLIEAAGIPGAVSIWADPLHDGPVPSGLTDAELVEVRTRHLAGSTDQATVDPMNDMRHWRAVIARHDAYDELILWFEHDLFDQLNLIQLLTWIRERVPATKVVSLVCIGSFAGHPDFKGLGELTPKELASLLDTRQRVTEAQYAVAEQTWRAFREPSPEALDELRQANLALPYLAAALTRFLEEYPWTSDGLSRSERRLLQLAAAGAIDLWDAFRRMHDDEDVYDITDTSLADLAKALSRTSPPLLTRAPRQSSGTEYLDGSVTLTETGRAVLASQQDRIVVCGIDRWLGGVHLTTGADLFRWDDTGQKIMVPRHSVSPSS